MHRARGLDLQCREALALRVIEQVRDLARKIRARRHVSAIILYGSFSRGDFHEGSDVDLIVVGDVPERFHKAGRQPSSISLISRSNRSATPRKSSPNWSGAATRSSSRHWPKVSACRREHTSFPISCTAEPLDLRSPRCTPVDHESASGAMFTPGAPVDDRLSTSTVPQSLSWRSPAPI